MFKASDDLTNLEKRKLATVPLIQTKINCEDLKTALNQKVLNQATAVEKVLEKVQIWQAGIADKEKPIGVFLFVGPTGTGKTELAKALQKALYQNRDFIQIDMSNYSGEHAGAGLIGSVRGYTGSNKPSNFVNALTTNPRRVVLLDEIEKASKEVYQIFLSVFDTGILADSYGNKIDCSQAIFIMTSNLAAQEILDLGREKKSYKEILDSIKPKLKARFSPEFYVRINPVVFNPIQKDMKERLLDLELNNFKNEIFEKTGINIDYSTSLRASLLREEWDETEGVRGLQKQLDPIKLVLAQAITNNKIVDKKYTLGKIDDLEEKDESDNS